MPDSTRSVSRRSLPVLPAGAAGAAGVVSAAAAPGVAAPGVAGTAAIRVAMVTLGCDKNTVDSERILSGLLGVGVEMAGSPEAADVVVVNTCGFIELAKEQSVETLLAAARLKEEGGIRAVVGMGCLVQRYKPELERELPEVDLFLGLSEADRLVPELARRGLLPRDVPLMERPLRALAAVDGARHTAHLKISEGCDHTCAFCAIPLMRGKFRSTPVERLVREARELERRGVVELSIVSQDTTWYGRDWARGVGAGEGAEPNGGGYYLGRPFAGMPNVPDAAAGRPLPPRREGDAPVRPGLRAERRGALPRLLETLLAETAIPWIRLFYMYPSGITPELVDVMAREPRILPYLDMPIQHGSDRVLKRMRRPERRTTILEKVGWLRDAVPDLALRTTVIVGFPGETEDDFDALLDLLERVGFDHVGAFAYSEEEDTPAATMSGSVPASVRRERLERLLDHQRAISLERNEARIGRVATVLVDELVDETGAGGSAVGRAFWQAAEVDGVVRIEAAAGLEPGRFVSVRITGADEYDLTGRAVG